MTKKPVTLDQLIKGLPVITTKGDLSGLGITGIACDSRKVTPNTLFAAVPGTILDGHDYIPQAIASGAVGLLVSRLTPESSQAPAVVQVPNVRISMGQIAGRLYGHPDHHIQNIAITGTNGKTTISYILESILTSAGAIPGVVGTVNYRIRDLIQPALTTTPESIDLFELLSEMKQKQATHMIVEVSSHALDQYRVAGLCFNGAVFTNLSRDHLDYHHGMESYFRAKEKLFREVLPGVWESDRPAEKPIGPAVVNIDDPYGREIAAAFTGPVITFGMQTPDARIRAENIQLGMDTTSFDLIGLNRNLTVHSSLLGRHNVSNLLAGIAMAHAMQIRAAHIETGIKNLKAVPGRLEAVPNQKNLAVLVDYAHTPDALSHALQTCRELLRKDGRLTVVFGAGGDRDRGKRPLMGEVAARHADLPIITSDNPRREDPRAIIEDIIPGSIKAGASELNGNHQTEKGYRVIPDRREAIQYAIAHAGPDDIVLIAGKGHEDYQIIGTTKHPFDDRLIAAETLAQR